VKTGIFSIAVLT